jgi:hypothetical protein
MAQAGTNGSSGSSGTSGVAGSSGSSGTSGVGGSSGSSGTSGTSFESPYTGNVVINGQAATTRYDNGTSGAVNFNNSNIQSIELTSNTTFTFSNPLSGASYTLELEQGGSGGYLATWPGSVEWAGGSAPTLQTGIGAKDFVSFVYIGTTYYGFSAPTNGTSGSSGSSGTSGVAGSSGSSGTSGDSGSSGSSGTSGTSGDSGSSGSSGSSGTSGADGSSGSSGTSGVAGSSGSSGTSGVAGSSGSSGTSGTSASGVLYSRTTPSGSISFNTAEAIAESILIPGGTYTQGDILILDVLCRRNTSGGGTTTTTWRARFNTSNSLSGATQIAAGGQNTGSNGSGTLSTHYTRTYHIAVAAGTGDGTLGYATTTDADNDWYVNNNNNNLSVTLGINWNNDVYILLTAQNTSALDTSWIQGYYLKSV